MCTKGGSIVSVERRSFVYLCVCFYFLSFSLSFRILLRLSALPHCRKSRRETPPSPPTTARTTQFFASRVFRYSRPFTRATSRRDKMPMPMNACTKDVVCFCLYVPFLTPPPSRPCVSKGRDAFDSTACNVCRCQNIFRFFVFFFLF